MDSKKITLKSGKILEVAPFVTGRVQRELKSILYSGRSISIHDGVPESSISMNAIQDAQDKAVELLVRSFDGSDSDILNRILDLPSEETDEILSEIDKLSIGLSDQKKG